MAEERKKMSAVKGLQNGGIYKGLTVGIVGAVAVKGLQNGGIYKACPPSTVRRAL